MKIALDHDNTYTVDAGFWDEVIKLAKAHGHEIFFFTMRHPHDPIHPHPDPQYDIRTVYSSRKAKTEHAKLNGIAVDVWIDDDPRSLLFDFISRPE